MRLQTRNFRLHLRTHTIHHHFHRYRNLLCHQNHSKSSLGASWVVCICFLSEIFSNIPKFTSHLLNTWQKQDGGKSQAKQKQLTRENILLGDWKLIVTNLPISKDLLGQRGLHLMCRWFDCSLRSLDVLSTSRMHVNCKWHDVLSTSYRQWRG